MNRILLLLAILLLASVGIWWGLAPQSPIHAEEAGMVQQSALVPAPADLGHNLTIVGAYAAIPHDRTPFLAQRSTQSSSDTQYLTTLFAWTDLAVVQRVASQQVLQSSPTAYLSPTGYESILDGVSELNTPSHLRSVQKLVREAIAEQRAYLEEWQASGRSDYFNRRHPLVLSSHRKLIAAYKKLMGLYGDEGAHNKKAFYDHLCALDFI